MRTDSRTYVIAEAGVNHNGDVETAKRLIDVAAEAGADAVKFQSFRAAALIARHAKKADYQYRTTGAHETQLEMVKRLELSEDDHETLLAHAQQCGIAFLSTPFDTWSLDLLTRRLGIRTIKVPSGEITNGPFLLAIARAAERLIVSTGMSTLDEVQTALGVLAFGFTQSVEERPASLHDFTRAFASENGQQQLRDRVCLLHCTTEYPAPLDEVNLRAMDTLAAAFSLPVGYSDHTIGIHISLAAVARGAQVIEKHVTLDRQLPGPDHAASLEPPELRQLVRHIRDIEDALGTGIKQPAPSETRNRDVARRSLVAAKPIRAGEQLTEENLTCKRPGTGVSPMQYWSYLGRTAATALDGDDLLP